MMTLDEIRNSGLLEAYVIGDVSMEERYEVEQALLKFPELKLDIAEIETALEVYALAHARPLREGLKNELLAGVLRAVNEDSSIDNTAKDPKLRELKTSGGTSKIKWWRAAAAILLFTNLASLSYLYNGQNKANEQLNAYQVKLNDCDELQRKNSIRLASYQNALSPDSRDLKVAPTPKYAETDLIFFTDDKKEKNYIQVNRLPALAANQSFQLWALKEGSDPIPLTVFDRNEGQLLEVDFVASTATYAITIEKKGGSKTPDLEKLIGTFANS